MISARHLLWIIPVSTMLGLFVAALAVASGREDHERERNELYTDDL